MSRQPSDGKSLGDMVTRPKREYRSTPHRAKRRFASAILNNISEGPVPESGPSRAPMPSSPAVPMSPGRISSSSDDESPRPRGDAGGMSTLPDISPRALNQVVVEPLSLVYDVNQGHRINVVKEIKISNFSPVAIAYRIRTNAPKNHYIKPKKGFLAGEGNVRIRVITTAKAGQFPKRAKLQVQVAALTHREAGRGNIDKSAFWKRVEIERRRILDTFISCKWEKSPAKALSDPSVDAKGGDFTSPTSPPKSPTSPASPNNLSGQGAPAVEHTRHRAASAPAGTGSLSRQPHLVRRRVRLHAPAGKLKALSKARSPPSGNPGGRPSAPRRRSKTHHHDAVIIHPHVLTFYNNSTPSQWSKKVTLTNTSTMTCAFKIKTNAPNHHIVVPHSGFVPPGQKASVHISVRGRINLGSHYAHRLLVMFTHIGNGEATLDPDAFWADPTRSNEYEDLVIPCKWSKGSEGRKGGQERKRGGANASGSLLMGRIGLNRLTPGRARGGREKPTVVRKKSFIRRVHLIVDPIAVTCNPGASEPVRHIISLKNIGSKDMVYRVSGANPRLVARPSQGFICTGTRQRLVLIAQPDRGGEGGGRDAGSGGGDSAVAAEGKSPRDRNDRLIVEAAEVTVQQLSKHDPSDIWELSATKVAFRTTIKCSWEQPSAPELTTSPRTDGSSSGGGGDAMDSASPRAQAPGSRPVALGVDVGMTSSDDEDVVPEFMSPKAPGAQWHDVARGCRARLHDATAAAAYLLKSRNLAKLLKQSPVPLSLRTLIWSIASGALEARRAHKPNYYSTMLARAKVQREKPEFRAEYDEVVQDVYDGLESAALEDDAKVASTPGRRANIRVKEAGNAAADRARNVLFAYCARNPDAVGYCQGMHAVAEGLLSVCEDEEDAFWLLCMVVERLAKGCYTKYMAGVNLNIKVFERLVMYTLPNLSRRLEEKGIMVSTFATQWMLSLFMRNPFRVDKALALWDFYFLQGGANALFAMGIGLLRFHKERLLKTDGEEILDFILHSITDGIDVRDLLINADIAQMNSWVITLQKSYEPDTIRHHLLLSPGQCSEYAAQPGVVATRPEEVQAIWSQFLAAAPKQVLFDAEITDLKLFARAVCNSIFPQTEARFFGGAPEWTWEALVSSGAAQRLFDMTASHEGLRSSVTFIRFLRLVSIFLHGSNFTRLRLAFDFFDRDGKGVLSDKDIEWGLGVLEMAKGIAIEVLPGDLMAKAQKLLQLARSMTPSRTLFGQRWSGADAKRRVVFPCVACGRDTDVTGICSITFSPVCSTACAGKNLAESAKQFKSHRRLTFSLFAAVAHVSPEIRQFFHAESARPVLHEEPARRVRRSRSFDRLPVDTDSPGSAYNSEGLSSFSVRDSRGRLTPGPQAARGRSRRRAFERPHSDAF